MTDERTYDPNNDQRRSVDRRRSAGGTMTEPVTDDRTSGGATGTEAGAMERERLRSGEREQPIESQRTSRQGQVDVWPEMSDYRRRFEEIQSRFIEEPREAVREAEKLVEEAIDRMSTSMRGRIGAMHRDAESGDTEKLRVAMKGLRDFIESMGGRRATMSNTPAGSATSDMPAERTAPTTSTDPSLDR